MEIENIPDKIKPLLNKFIRIGKRNVIQFDFFARVSRRHDELEWNLTSKLEEVNTDKYKVSSSDGWVWFAAGLPEDSVSTRLSFAAPTFRDIFKIPDCLPQYSDFPEYLERAKKHAAFEFFLYRKYYPYYSRVNTFYRERKRILYRLYNEIREKWNEIYPVKVGDTIKTNSTGEEGVIEYISKVGGEDIFTVKFKDGIRYIPHYQCKWGFIATNLVRYMDKLFDGKIPDIWKENKLNFYS